MATPIPSNQTSFSAEELRTLLGAPLGTSATQAERAVTSVTTDSRAVVDGALFVALVGETMDGHAFAKAAVEKGAAAVVLSRDVPDLSASVQRYVVPDTLVAWGNLAAHALARFRAADARRRVFMVTGSSGKTTTKEMLAELLSLRGKTARTAGNLNNRIGLPATIFALSSDAVYCVLEAGMSLPGEMALLAEIVRPDVSTIVNVGLAHAEGVGGQEGVLREKRAVYEYLREEGVAVVNRDDAFVVRGAAEAPQSARRVSYGRATLLPHGEGYRLLDRQVTGGGATLTIERESGPSMEIATPFPGEAQALDFLCALATAESVVPPFTTEEMATALRNVTLTGRSTVHERPGDATVIDDSYNANPSSMAASLRTAREMARHRGARLVAVLGEMKELGPFARKAHQELGEDVAAAGVSLFIGCGGLVSEALSVAEARGVRTLGAKDAAEAAILASREVYAKDVVLVKASRSVGAEEVVRALLARRAP